MTPTGALIRANTITAKLAEQEVDGTAVVVVVVEVDADEDDWLKLLELEVLEPDEDDELTSVVVVLLFSEW